MTFPWLRNLLCIHTDASTYTHTALHVLTHCVACLMVFQFSYFLCVFFLSTSIPCNRHVYSVNKLHCLCFFFTLLLLLVVYPGPWALWMQQILKWYVWMQCLLETVTKQNFFRQICTYILVCRYVNWACWRIWKINYALC